MRIQISCRSHNVVRAIGRAWRGAGASGDRSKSGFLPILAAVVVSWALSWKLSSVAALFAAVVLGIVVGVHFVPYLPPPAGPFPVGTVLWGIDRPGAGSLPLASGGCPLSVQLWYPAESGSGDGPAPYRPNGAGLFSVARWVRTSATLNASLSAHRTRYPVLVYLPAWDGSQGENTVLVQDLASRGFIVAAIGYDDPACAGIDGSASNPVPTGLDLSSQSAFEHTVGIAHQKIDRVSKAISHIIDRLETVDRVDPTGRFRGRLDLDRMGVIGYSLGGAIAMQSCWRDDRLKAAVNIDGWLFDAAPGGWIEQPLMIISDDTPPATSTDIGSPDPARRFSAMLGDTDARRVSSEFAKYGGTYLVVVGSEHGDFSDSVYLRRRALLLGPRANGGAIRNAADYSAAFFDQILNGGEVSPLFSSPPPGVRLQTWNRSLHEERPK
jgi:dienelactone hydrolase